MSKSLPIPANVLDQHLVMLGKTGSGKSSKLRVLVEHLHSQGKRVCIVDPKGDWWGIKVAADGKSPGLPFVLFGDFKNAESRDVPINDRSGKHIAELIASGNRPCVIGMRGWTQGAMIRFWIDFAQTIFARNAGELYLVLDEAHNFAPKQWKGQSDKETPVGVALHWTNRLLSEGRGLGLICLLASQRPQKVHNDSLTSCEGLFALRVVHAADREAIKNWIDGNGDTELGKQVLASLAAMPRTDGWVWAPEVGFGPKQITFPMFTTFDSFAPPQLQKRVSNKSWADVDLSAVQEKLASVIEEEKNNDPTELKRRVAALEKELTAKTHSREAVPAMVKTVEKHIITDKQLERLESIVGWINGRTEKVIGQLAPIVNLLSENLHKENTAIAELVSAARAVRNQPSVVTPGVGRVAPPAPARPSNDGDYRSRSAKATIDNAVPDDAPDWMQPAHAKLLNALIWLAQFGVTQPDRATVGAVAGVSPSSSSFMNNLSRLSANGLVKYPRPSLVEITDAGKEMTTAPPESTDIATLHQMWRECPAFSPAHVRLLDALIASYPHPLTRDELAVAAKTSVTSSSFMNNVSRLSSIGVAEYPEKGMVKATTLLFPPSLK